ncbi:metal-dependent transcriptional regulator [Niabella insulamsoli]|uniref:metal-dependent transcriptional regulator n=1 Tax=Niabella insulamsoli TaxID=3144874 RepID=UPI0031FC38A3
MSYLYAMLSQTEENYLKALFYLTEEAQKRGGAGTNELASTLDVKPATVNDMLKKLKEKDLVVYEKYKKVTLTDQGKKQAINVIRKHRLWETFLYEKLEFTWDEVHEVAEQLEHIHSPKLIEQLEKFLGYPEFDPHGDAIPNAQGVLKRSVRYTLAQVAVGKTCKLVAVKDNSASFLQFVVKVGLGLSSKITVLSRQDFDGSAEIEVLGKKSIVSQKFAENIFVTLS